MEHLRSEGWFRQLFGRMRPAILMLYVIGGMVLLYGGANQLYQKTSDVWGLLLGFWTLFTLALLSLMTVFQIVVHRQRMPHWTAKAVLMCVLCLGISALVGGLTVGGLPIVLPLLPFLCLLQPLFLVIAWLVLKPIDHVLKRRILLRAMELRKNRLLTVIGVTGSVGKTTTKELIGHLLAVTGNPVRITPEHVNSELGVAQWLADVLKEAPDGTTLVIEMGAYRKREIDLLCRIVKPTLGVVTYVGTQHLALFGSLAALQQAKAELLHALPADGHVFLNADSPPCAQMKQFCTCPVTLAGTVEQAEVRAVDIQETSDGLSFLVHTTAFHVPLHGMHNITNILLAIAVGQHLQVPMQQIADQLRTFTPLQKTFEVEKRQGVTILNDTHNSSEPSLRAAILWARNQPQRRKILVTTGIIELGREEERVHRELGLLAKDVFTDVLFLSPILGTYFAAGMGKPVLSMKQSKQLVQSGDLLVCVGKMPGTTIDKLLSTMAEAQPQP